MLTPENPGEVFCVDQAAEEIKVGAAKPPLWRGLTVFYTEAQEKQTPATHTYFQAGGKLMKATFDTESDNRTFQTTLN